MKFAARFGRVFRIDPVDVLAGTANETVWALRQACMEVVGADEKEAADKMKR